MAYGNRPERYDSGDDRSFDDTMVKLYRCATVVKGGRRFSFGALVVVGDRRGQVGFGYGKANEVPQAVEKGVKQGRRRLVRITLRGTTIPHRIIGKFGSSRVVMIPAAPGTGVIAGAAPRAVLELAGIKDVLTKCYGSTSPKNLVKATLDGLQRLRTREYVERLRGVRLAMIGGAAAAPQEAAPEMEYASFGSDTNSGPDSAE
jgi:small subunit ribosomal protein S5